MRKNLLPLPLTAYPPEAEKAIQELSEKKQLPNQQESSELPKVGDYYQEIETKIVYKITEVDKFIIIGRGVFRKNESFHYSDLKTFLEDFEKVETDNAPRPKPSLQYIKAEYEHQKRSPYTLVLGLPKKEALLQLKEIIKYIEES